MKAIINSLKSPINNWFCIFIKLFAYLFLLIFFSCQKDEDIFLTQESVNNLDLTKISTSSCKAFVIYYGPQTFARVSGVPFVETQKIENPEFEHFKPNFTLKIRNGSDKKTRVSSAEIKINGRIVAGPSDFSKHVSLITKKLHGITPVSVLKVKLKGAPGSFIDLWIEGILKEANVTDIDRNVYNTIKIGSQVWMKENLMTTKLSDGTNIPLVADNTAWINLMTPGFCWYNNDQGSYGSTYGALYNWHAVNTGKLCPVGWHVPTDLEWTVLSDYLGGTDIAGGKMKEAGTAHWGTPNTGATNESGFTALPGGWRRPDDGKFYHITVIGFWWSSTEGPNPTKDPFVRILDKNGTGVSPSTVSERTTGCSIRCVKD